ncbi:unnamed protein product [Malassezia sympodialis ATCC 42132]|uniref:Similar to S.cerevisiae protein VPS74 (Golgi phosphatidylinositol-4-kinase effector and PtdIns4P sensor) n=1 Tax=Malassezia sympodialis (strain ATCC 42132) TaxID=1230383 RepID=M5EAG9_MALS4|nr:uncharacterized protein MSY001_2317 [Malassezia sympodialis ATCC 42132]CCU99611.1 unnamed protein product [Malassezia sympodialis ATCC 42132]SHO76928.1 Similar to S.cerevisiae protein VPS74 (Golgi phosphatidylinositol-4-kinase effector and PtdIns4P sensor) [Malassezia sympodialis ATCC 42132]|eukprot:XP_018740851.1 uncharacterized protein MSY001_2317 [Malassezia sympodialis ATCC 42132]
MASTSGLQRRRGAGHASLSNELGDEEMVDGVRSLSGQRSAAAIERSSGSGSLNRIDPGSGHQVAYDPRDLMDAGEERTCPRLTLMEEVLLLGLKDTQGYLSFWNDKLSYTLRGCILMELALRGRIGVAKGADQRREDVSDSHIRLYNARPTGEPLLDETLRHIHQSPPTSIVEWVNLLSGDTWNMMRLNMQLKQVRERLAKGLVEKGVLCTEKRNFLLFDMPTHPVVDMSAKDAVRRRVYALTLSQNIHGPSLYKDEKDGRAVALPVTRSLCMLCSALSADVLENVLRHLSTQVRDQATAHVDDLLRAFAQWPMAPNTPGGGLPPRGSVETPQVRTAKAPSFLAKRRTPSMGVSSTDLANAMRAEYEHGGVESAFEVIAGVLQVLARMESLV